MAIAATGINGCSQDKRVRLTYGTLVGDKAEELEYGELATKVGRGENMLVAVYQDGLPCGCWSTFHDVLPWNSGEWGQDTVGWEKVLEEQLK